MALATESPPELTQPPAAFVLCLHREHALHDAFDRQDGTGRPGQTKTCNYSRHPVFETRIYPRPEEIDATVQTSARFPFRSDQARQSAERVFASSTSSLRLVSPR